VTQSRDRAEAMLIQWAKDWDLDCSLENANDVFFTDDYAVKATFQRQSEGKKELRLAIPGEGRSISCGSSNFHGSTFGRAWGIEIDGRAAVSGCMGWGLERWAYAVFAQFGLDPSKWPAALRADLEHYAPGPDEQ
jgi:seryl-tRNA synthetase